MTRPKELISEMSAKLRSAGAEVLELPAIRTVPCEDQKRLVQALKEISTYQWLVFTSPTGVRVFFEEMDKQHMDIRALCRIRLAVIGSGTAKELKKHGLYPDLMPEEFYGEALGKALAETCQDGEHILIPRAATGNQELVQILKDSKKVTIDDIATYDTIYAGSALIDEKQEFENGSIDYAVFTSASTVKGFAEATKGLDYAKVHAVCIGRQTKAAADALGMQTEMSEKPTMDSVVEKVAELCQKQG